MATAVLVALLACTVGARANVELRFCENRADAVVLELVETSSPTERQRPWTIVAVPPAARCRLVGDGARFVRILGQGRLRDVKLVSLAAEQTRMRSRGGVSQPLRVEVEFNPAATGATEARKTLSPYVEAVFRSLAINYPFPDQYRSNKGMRFDVEFVPPPFGRAERAVKIEVEPPGRVRIAASELRRLTGRRWDAQRMRKRICLWHEGRPFPFMIERDRNSDAAIVFDAASFESRYTRWDVYWLTYGGEQEGNIQAGDRAKSAAPPPVASLRLRLRRLAADLRSPADGADLIYICHPEFLDEIGPLVRWRKRQGLRVAVVSSEDVADVFNFGRDEPVAIRRFLAWAYRHWPAPPPAYVALVGDASAEPKRDDPAIARNFISTIYGEGADPPAYDDGYVAFLAGNPLPQMMLGRISVNEAGQLAAIVEKLVAHERKPQLGPWRGRVLLLADNGYERLFDESVTRWIPTHLDVSRIDVRDFPYVDHYNLERTKISPACRKEVVGQLDQSAVAVHYVGHGGVSLISHEKMFFWTDVARLRNHGRLPLFVQISCRTGGFDWPEQQWNACLSELLLRRGGAGALGVIAASRALFGDEAYLQRCLFYAYRGRRAMTIGEVKMLMKVPYLLNRRERDFIDSYNLLGDPASRLAFAAPLKRLAVSPECLTVGQGGTVTVEGRLPVARRADVLVWMRGPSGRVATAVQRVTARRGRFSARLDLPDDPQPGRWQVAAYAIAGLLARTDYQGVAQFEVGPPRRTYPNDPRGFVDLAFVGDRFEFAKEDLVDGETIQVRAWIENRGTARSQPTRLVWEWKRASGDEQLKRVASAQIPPLYPTERRKIALRWDPYDNAGEIDCVLRIVPASGESRIANNSATRRLHVKAKPDLTLASPPRWKRQGRRLQLIVSVANRGEDDAEMVEVKLFLGDGRGPRLPLGRPYPVASLIRGGERSAECRWTVRLPDEADSLDYLYLEITTAEPVSEIDKRNNRFRFRIGSPSGGIR